MAFISSGTTILDNGAFSVGLGSKILISEQTASGSGSISFTTGIDSTYDIYQFEFTDVHPQTDNVLFQFNLSTDGGSNYNVTKTTTFFRAYHLENDGNAGLGYDGARDLAQSTGFQQIAYDVGNGSDECTAGGLILFNPSSTTYVKHFISRSSQYHQNSEAEDVLVAGYGNTTSAVNAIRFQMSSGNIDAGTFKMYGIKGS